MAKDLDLSKIWLFSTSSAKDLRTIQAGAGEQVGDGRRDLPADAVRPGGDVHRPAPVPGEAAVARTEAHL